MFRLLKKSTKNFTSDSEVELPAWISLFLVQTYHSGCLAVEAEQLEIAKVAMCCIFDTINCIRMEYKTIDLEYVKVQIPKHCWHTSIPLPSTLGELELYTEKYLLGGETLAPLPKATILQELVL